MARNTIHETGFFRLTRTLRAALAAGLVALCGVAGGARAGEVELVSRVHPGQESDTASGTGARLGGISHPSPSISADGRYIVFTSIATNLVAGQNDVNLRSPFSSIDVFLHDRIAGVTTLVSRSLESPSTTANAGSSAPVISADGRYIAFTSTATDLVPGLTGRQERLFLFDRASENVTLLSSSVTSDPLQGGQAPVISANGRYIAFLSAASDLVPGQTDENRELDVFLHDRISGKTALVSHVRGSTTRTGSARSRGVAISADGRYVAFLGSPDLIPYPSAEANVYLYDRVSGALTLVGPHAGHHFSLSSNGRYVAFMSLASNLAPGQIDRNGSFDVFLYDRVSTTTVLVSHASGLPTTTGDNFAALVPVTDSNGRFIFFLSSASDLVPGQSNPGPALFLYDRISGRVALVSGSTGLDSASASAMSGDGRYLVFVSRTRDLISGQADTNNDPDVFLFDRISGTFTLVSSESPSDVVTGDAASYGPAISADGSYIAFYSEASNLVGGLKDLNQSQDVFGYETTSTRIEALSSHPPGMASLTPFADSFVHGISANGRFVVFESQSDRLVEGQIDSNGTTDVFLYDKMARRTTLVSRSSGSAARTGSGESVRPAISADGRYIAFASKATDLVPGIIDPSGQFEARYDIFLYDRTSGAMTLLSRLPGTNMAANASFPSDPGPIAIAISADGRFVAFANSSSSLIPGQIDSDITLDIFLYDRLTNALTLVSRSSAGTTKTGNSASSTPVLSPDGRYVVFFSHATDLIPGHIDSQSCLPSTCENLFLFDRSEGTTALVSRTAEPDIASGGATRADLPSLSADGRYIGFTNFNGDVVLYDRLSRNTALVSRTERAASESRGTKISADGRFVAFISEADGLVPGPAEDQSTQVFLYDRISGVTTVVSRSTRPEGGTSNGKAETLDISTDGRYIAFTSTATDLIRGQIDLPTPIGSDMFLYDRVSGRTDLVSRSKASSVTAVGGSTSPFLSADGQILAFNSRSQDLVTGDFNLLRSDVFLYTHGPTAGGPTPLPRCTLLDTRRTNDGPALRSKSRKVLRVHGACGVPVKAKSVSVKVTVFQPTGKGNLQFYPGNSTTAQSGILRFERGQTRSGSFTLPLATNGAGTLGILPTVSGNGTVHVVVEVNGYVE
jgi:Tol biopolymer transport system component